MGEVNEASNELIARVIGQEPQTLINEDSTMSLHLGQTVITAQAALWSDLSAFLNDDGTLTVSWGAQRVRIPAGSPLPVEQRR